jgi:3'-phosphoadenosine 5'-phosphosulfate sulfotransferase (PAPS reductase)/FAD synthetase
MPPARWCTSDHKRGPILKLITRLSVEWYADNPGVAGPFRILQAIGLRSEESSERQKHKPLSTNRKSSGRRTITDWLPIQDWLVGTVWDTIQRSGVPYHYAYDLGICRVGCVFCFYKTRAELALSALHNPELADAFAAMEVEARSTFKHGLSMSDVIADAKQLRESARSGPAELTRAG